MFKLKFTIPLLGLILSVAIIGFQYISLSSDLAIREIQFAKQTLTNTANTLQGNLNTNLAQNNLVGVKQDISDVNFLPSARLVYLIDENDNIISSGRLGLVGKTSRDVEQPIEYDLLGQVRSQMSGKIFSRADSHIFAIYPVVMGRNPGEFRPSRIGVAVIEFDLTENIASLRSSVLDSTVKSAMVILLVLFIGGIAIQFLLTNRVSKILESAHQYISGDRAVRVNLSGSDELAIISKAFDDVADSVEAAEEEVLIRQQSLNNAQRIAHLGNLEWDIASGELFWSDEIFRIFGHEPQGVSPTYDAFLKAVHPDDQKLVQDAVGQALETKSTYRIEHRVVRPDGTERMVLQVGELKLDNAGEALTMTGTVLDITETFEAQQEVIELNATLEKRVEQRTQALQEEVKDRQIAQDKYQESEERTRQIVNSAVDGIITIDKKGIIKTFNTAAENIFGFSIVDVAGKNVSMLMPKQIADQHEGYLENYHQTGYAKIIGSGREVIGQCKDKSTFVMDLSVSEFTYNGEQTFVGIVRDITKRKGEEYKLQSTLQKLQDTQEHLVQSEKMASLGGLVAGVAHEINTPIGVGLTAATHLHEEANRLSDKFISGNLKKSDFVSFVEVATQSTKIVEANLVRASDLIRSFKQVAVDQSSEEKRQIKVIEYIDEVLESLRPNLKRAKHEITISGDHDTEIVTHPGALSQIVTNLVMNSVIHAYDEGDVGHIRILVEQNNKSTLLKYSDDGKGMDEDVCNKIFEPFFTTKRGSGGSGLGMHILYNQVTQTLGGSIDLHSNPGQGTTFEIKIPISSGEVQ